MTDRDGFVKLLDAYETASTAFGQTPEWDCGFAETPRSTSDLALLAISSAMAALRDAIIDAYDTKDGK